MNEKIIGTISRSLKYYTTHEINGKQLSQSISEHYEGIDELDKNKERTFKYYINFFEKEGGELFNSSNTYLADEVAEMEGFLKGFMPD